ncbi:MAG: 6-pyruvoyl-tetrahydropterin synthase-related protein, partial [Dehalococcoidia bacterium]|nr:6-pyruvoyl-tetrahydropterin synthase-related protein [Dehalococcoidia bacterium]
MRQKISRLRSHQALRLGLPLLVALLALPALRPLTLPGLLSGHDSSLHLFRFVELHRLIVSGDYFPRWFPDLSLGHGYPLLNYYPPLTYYLFEAFHLLGFAFVNAIDLTMALGVILSGLGMYCFGLQVSGRRSVALLAAIAFMYMPYRLVDIYVRGAWAEATAFAFIPWLFASFYALATRRSITYLLTSALLLAGLFLTHQVSIYFVPVLFVYSLAVALRSSYPRKGIALIAVAMFSGLAASAFYWFPAMAEVSFASTENFILSDLSPAQRLMLVPFDLIIQPQLLYHFGAPPFQMGLVEAVAAFSGLSILLAVFARGRREFLPVLVLPAAAVLLACLMTPFSSFFFEKVLVANSIQFAYRLLALIGTFAAVCTGFLAFPRRLGTYLAVAVGGVLVFAATCSLPVSHEEVPDYGLSLGMASRYEITRYRPGLSHENEWLPLVANLGAGQSPQEVAPLSQTTVEMMAPLAYRFKTAADAATSLRYHAYAFPGWQAKVDGQAVAVYPSQPLGLVSVDVPSGNHTVDLWFTDTPARTVGRLITIAALLALAIVSLARGRRWKAGYY